MPALTSALFGFLKPELSKYFQGIGRGTGVLKVFALMFQRIKGFSKELPPDIQKFEELHQDLKNPAEHNKLCVSLFLQVLNRQLQCFSVR